jgi:Na+-translocating ferredoxin:NAD+ oxidoreductase RnfD subunit
MNGVFYFLRSAKGLMLLAFVALLAIAMPSAGGIAGLWPNMLAALVPACLIDAVWMLATTRRVRWPTSALLSGLFIFSILSVEESWLVIAWTSAFSVLAKRILRGEREHFFNPAALALVWAPIAFGSGESWWGAFGDLSWMWLPVLLVIGVVLTDRLNKFPLVLTFLLVYFGSFTLAATVVPHQVAEMFRAPFLQAALFLAFFMLTDPPTSPNRYADQVWFGGLAAVASVVAQLIGAGQTYLLLGILVANAALGLERYARRQDAVTVPVRSTATR